MDGRELRARRTRILAREHDRRLRRAAVVVAILHATVIVFFVAPTARTGYEGRVTATDVIRSSGVPACDAGVVEWALTTAWTTAYNRDQAVEVWIAQPIQLVSR